MEAILGLPTLIALITVALVFDFLNGLHDAANSIATVVSTRVLKPQYAVVWAAFFNFIAFLFFGLHVAQTIGTGIVAADVVDAGVIFGALMGAICWNLITWWLGIPSSSSHALIGGLAGAGMMKAGTGAIVWFGLGITGAAIILSPLLGFCLALALVLAVSWIFVRSTPVAVNNTFGILQFVSASLYSLGHGGNDAQKTMGIIAGVLFTAGYIKVFEIPLWVILAAHAAISLGTLAGGWRIIHTMGSKITKLQPVSGFAAETGAAIAIFTATHFGIPVSTTHAITGAIVGVGATRRLSAVRWGVAGRIVWAWLLTIPMAAFMGGLMYWVAAEFGAK
jgi:inorganic phosphate transporter, PiT family